MNADLPVYLDSSALVKLVVRENESEALRRYLRGRRNRVSCALARVEVLRAVRAHGAPAVTRGRLLLARISLLRLDDALLDAAAALGGATLRGHDAIHLAAASAFGEEVVTYDVRMADAAKDLGLRVTAPVRTSRGPRA